MLNEFKKFILRGNVIDLAVGVVIGVAFGAVITSLVKDLLTPLIAAIFGKTDFSMLQFTLRGSKFLYGDFINSVVSFLSIATVLFFCVVQPINKLQSYANRNRAVEDPTVRICPECLSEIPIKAHRCKYCTAIIR